MGCEYIVLQILVWQTLHFWRDGFRANVCMKAFAGELERGGCCEGDRECAHEDEIGQVG